MTWELHHHDARHISDLLEPESVDLIVTSPPYFALRSYRDAGVHYESQIGSEPTPSEFVDALIACTRDWLTVLKPTGSLWVNLGDSYAGSGGYNNTAIGAGGRGPTSYKKARYGNSKDGLPSQWTVSAATWLAGVIDCDGSISARYFQTGNSPSVVPWVRVGMMDAEVVMRCAEITGVGRVFKDKRDVWNWSVSSQAAGYVLERIWPHLLIKQRQALAAIDICRHVRECGARGRWNPITDEQATYRRTAVDAIHAWNRRDEFPWSPRPAEVLPLPHAPINPRAKSLHGLPWRYALRCIDELGLILRAEVIWSKPNCLSGGTMLYARINGRTTTIKVHDLCRHYRPENVELWNGQQWTQVVWWQPTDRNADGDVEIEFRSGERIGCTSEHRWPTQRGLVQAADLVVGDVVETTRLPEGADRPASLDDEMIGWFVGLYIAEGSRSEQTIQIAGHVKEVDRYKRLCEIAEAFHGTCHVYATKGNTATINLTGRMLHAIIDTYVGGRTSGDKHLHPKAWRRNDFFLRAVLDGYLSGDGHWDVNLTRWSLGFTANDAWAADLRTLAARLGVSVRLRRGTVTGFDREWSAWIGTLYDLPERRKRPDSEVVAIRASRARRFWDIGVADEPHLFALASGVLTHNSLPESVTDRVRRSHEQWFWLQRGDGPEVVEPAAEGFPCCSVCGCPVDAKASLVARLHELDTSVKHGDLADEERANQRIEAQRGSGPHEERVVGSGRTPVPLPVPDDAVLGQDPSGLLDDAGVAVEDVDAQVRAAVASVAEGDGPLAVDDPGEPSKVCRCSHPLIVSDEPWLPTSLVRDLMESVAAGDLDPKMAAQYLNGDFPATHEVWFHFTREGSYFAAIDEVREAHARLWDASNGGSFTLDKGNDQAGATDRNGQGYPMPNPLGKAPGSVWSVPSEPLQVPDHLNVDHFAAFPSEWPRRIILGWSPSGYCTVCGEARRAVVDRGLVIDHVQRRTRGRMDLTDDGSGRTAVSSLGITDEAHVGSYRTTITGYACACPTPDAPTRPATVLDPFVGTGTVPAVAHLLGRHGIGTDLSSDYLRLARWRCESDERLRAKVLDRSGIARPQPPAVPGQTSLFDEVAP